MFRGARAIGVLMTVLSFSALADEVVPPEVISKVEAVPPPDAPAPLHEHVVLEFTISEEGTVHDIVVIESAGDVWDEAAQTALLQWRFKPALHQGKTVASRTRLMFNVSSGSAAEMPATSLDGGSSAEPLQDGGAGESENTPPEFTTRVMGRSVPKSVAPSDFHVEVGELRLVPRKNATDFLKLAPGILITNEGGIGHADQIFLRGFDAREGQDVELTFEGVPINESGNLHGNGYADLSFIIPELIENIRVVEGPFDPRQGNYAVAGSADFELGLTQRGLSTRISVGQFSTQRLVILWGPPGESSRSFAAGQLFRTQGFGQNRDAQSGSVMGQYELALSQSVTARVGAQAYATKFHSAGVLRADDVQRDVLGFYDTYDSRQGGDTARFSLWGDVHHHGGPYLQQHQVFVTLRNGRLIDNFTGFVNDTQQLQQNPHTQRGDAIDRDAQAWTFGAKGFARYRARAWGRPQDIEVGYFGRVDITDGVQQRLMSESLSTPYKRELDLRSTLGDIGLYGDLTLKPLEWLTLKGGVRADLFTFNVLNRCAVQSVRRPSEQRPPGDASCLDQMDFGIYREPDERASAVGTVVMPRGTLTVGPFKGASISGAVGQGVRSIDPQFVNQNTQTPFASILAWEGGAMWSGSPTSQVDLSARAVAFGTRVDKDLIFSQQAGRNIIGGSTSRLGGLAALRSRGSFFDVSMNVTYVKSTFDDTGLLVPYVPDLVFRGDGSVYRELPWRLLRFPVRLSLGLGYTWVGRRALPFGERSGVISVVDGNIEAGWRWLTFSVAATNLFNSQYRLGEYNYVSDFRQNGELPTLVPSRHFSAGAPRQVMFTLGINLGGGA